MKRYHPFFYLGMLVISFLFFTACSEKTENIPPFLEIGNKTVSFNNTPSSREVTVKCHTDDWKATVSENAISWLKATPQSRLLRISADENKDLDVRKGEIIITAGNLNGTIVVEQLGKDPAILLSAETFSLSADGGTMELEVTSNIDYDIVIPDEATWIKIKSGTRANDMVKKNFSFEVEWNLQPGERQTEITIRQKNGTLEKKAQVHQKARGNYEGISENDIKDDIKVPVSRATASSFQPGGEIEKSFDGDYSSIYHSSWNNSGPNYFPITLEYFFENQESIDYLLYYPRQQGHNGHFKEVEIWVATEEKPTHEKVMDHDFKGASIAARVSFQKPLVKPKSVKFIIRSGHGDGQGFAACAEMEFYRKNPDNFDPLTLFTDLTCSELKPGVTAEDIVKISNNLYRNIALYLFNDIYPKEFRIQHYKAWPHPDDWAHANKTSTLSLLDNPTGISIAEGEEMVVFVGETGGYPLNLKVQNLDKPGGDGYGNASYYPLSKGINKFKARNKGLAYVFYHTPDYQTAPPVTIHFATGKVNGYFDSRKHNAADWTRLVNAAVDDYFDVMGEHAHLTFPTAHFKTYAANNGNQLIDAYDELVRLEKEFMGLMKYNRPTVNRAYFHAMYHSYFYSTAYRTAYNITGENERRVLLNVNELKKSPWGPAHEQGHTFQTRPGFKWHGMTEVSNNVHSLWVQTQWGNPSRIEQENQGRYNNRYEKAFHNSFVKNTPHPGENDVFCKLVSLWQLQLYFSNARGQEDTYKDLYEKVRTSPDKPNAGEQQLEFVKMMCDVTRTDLTGFFRKWGYLSPFDQTIDDYGNARILITQSQIDRTVADIKAKNYPLLSEKVEYICDSNWEVFKNRLPVKAGSTTKSGKTITMTGWKNAVAYEVYEGESLVFVSNRASFTLDNPATAHTKVYAVAYDGTKTEASF
ncbi:M60 family metallopeptidase [Proteiniphilum sp. X52]|uniref:M60 family metallopeptidase n=1 Tax=Proteiniphilum sp. X52 TaxID=2382159 RepID=UPI000F09CDFB|nr:M60 family metallopeptidase [Proteiniphilum sp. X52]RNC63845.1 carbohydrate-binding protein [Proteiniphilum sp. X52]